MKRAAIEVAAELRAAVGAYDRRAFAEAIDHVVAAWSAAPLARIAAIAVDIDKRLPREGLPAMASRRDRAWRALAAERDPAALPTLLSAEWPRFVRDAARWIAELVEFPRDPRIAEAILGLFAAERFHTGTAAKMWQLALRTLVAWGEPRVATLAAATKKANPYLWEHVFSPLAADLKKLRPPTTSKAVAAPLAALEARLAAERPDTSHIPALFEAVYADPASDAPRIVLADALLALDDPRGELIQLQLSGKRGRVATRINELLRAHGAAWHGGVPPLEPPSFARGFVSAAAVFTPPADPPRSWRTVEQISFYGTQPDACRRFLAHDHVACAKVLRYVPFEAVTALAGRTLDELLLTGEPRAVARAPAVRKLVLERRGPHGPAASDPDALAWFAGGPFAATTEELVLHGSLALLAPAHAMFAASRLQCLWVQATRFGDGWSFELARTGAGIALATECSGLAGGFDDLAAVLAALPPTALAGFTLRTYNAPAGGRRTLDPAIRRALRRQTGLDHAALID